MSGNKKTSVLCVILGVACMVSTVVIMVKLLHSRCWGNKGLHQFVLETCPTTIITSSSSQSHDDGT